MKKIIAFGASSSKKSINKQFATYAAGLFENTTAEVLDLNNFEMPIYCVDKENESGIPTLANDFYNKLRSADLIIISFAEHNGSYTTSFKNIFDWVSRVNGKFFEGIPLLLLATSPGARGGSTVLEIANARFPYHGGDVKGSFLLPNFNTNFDVEKGITNESLQMKFLEITSNIEF